jgi:AraC family transcriptional regulator
MNNSKLPNNTVIRIEKAILYIEENLENKLVLEDIAQKAHFSPFHFHRLFSVVVGETLNNFINRRRLERAASFLINKRTIPVTEIAFTVGFSNLSSFSRAFKKFYGISPVEFRELSSEKFSKICKTKSKNGQISVSFEQYICNINNALQWLKMNAKTSVKHTEELSLAYISHQGKIDDIGNAYNKLIRWATPKGLMAQENLRMVTIYHDSPKISNPDRLRMSACIVLNSPIGIDHEIGLRTIEPCKCIISRFEISPNNFQQAWESSFVWMVENGYQKGSKDPFEIYYNNYLDHPEKKFIVDLCIPVQ